MNRQKDLLLVGLSVLVLVLAVSAAPVIVASAATPTPYPTISPIPPPSTPTPGGTLVSAYPTMDTNCPAAGTPIANWGTLTPSAAWLSVCSCMLTPTVSPTINWNLFNGYVTATGTPGTPVAYATATPTVTSSPTGTAVPSNVTWMSTGYQTFNGHVSVYAANCSTTGGMAYCYGTYTASGGSDQINYLVTVKNTSGASAHIYVKFNTTGTILGSLPGNNGGSWASGTQTKDLGVVANNGTYSAYWAIENTSSSGSGTYWITYSSVGYTDPPGATPTPTPVGTPSGPYCSSVHTSQHDKNAAVLPNVVTLYPEQKSCFIFSGGGIGTLLRQILTQIDSAIHNILGVFWSPVNPDSPWDAVWQNALDNWSGSLPGFSVCVIPVDFAPINVLGVRFDLPIFVTIAASAAMLVLLYKK